MLARFREWLLANGLADAAGRVQEFGRFEEALYAANATKNLTRVPREDAWLRHGVDSLMWHDLAPQGSRVLDVGTGPGFPAWPLAWARADLSVVAIDSNGKMLEFLRSQPLKNLEAVQGRAEEWTSQRPFDVVTGRAVAPLALQLELSVRNCAVGGRIIPMRTAKDLEEIRAFPAKVLALELADVVCRDLPGSDTSRVFPVFVKTGKTPNNLPRRWADMRAHPLAG